MTKIKLLFNLLDSFEFTQHIKEATYHHGNILDLLLTLEVKHCECLRIAHFCLSLSFFLLLT